MASKAQKYEGGGDEHWSVRPFSSLGRRRVRIALTCNHAAEQIPYRTQATHTQTAVLRCGSVDDLCETNAWGLIRKEHGEQWRTYL